jgi:hypothetical protein
MAIRPAATVVESIPGLYVSLQTVVSSNRVKGSSESVQRQRERDANDAVAMVF